MSKCHHTSFFYRPDALPVAQLCESTEGRSLLEICKREKEQMELRKNQQLEILPMTSHHHNPHFWPAPLTTNGLQSSQLKQAAHVTLVQTKRNPDSLLHLNILPG